MKKIELKTVYILKEIDSQSEEPKRESSIPKDRWGVHKTHCCEKHGCKYGNEDCPVALGLIKQAYKCQVSFDLDDDCFEPSIGELEKQELIVFTEKEYEEHVKHIQEEYLKYIKDIQKRNAIE